MVAGINSIDEFMDCVSDLSRKGNLYIAGAGDYGKTIGRFLTEKKVRWKAFIDKNTRLHQIEKKKVYSYAKDFSDKDFFIVSSYDYAGEIADELRNADVLEANIFIFPNIQDIVCDMYDFFVGWSKYTKKIQEFHNQYFGQRCFIIGNGPSLRIPDLEKLKNEITFGCNAIYAVYNSTSWRPDFYCAWDTSVCRFSMSKKEDVQRLVSASKAAFTSIMCEGFQFRDDNDINNLFYVRAKTEMNGTTGLPLFSGDCSRQVYTSGTVSYFMLQLAVYMGFREIYLLGIDASYFFGCCKDGTVRWNQGANYMDMIKKEEEKLIESVDEKYSYVQVKDVVDKQIRGYEAAQKYAEAHGIKIYNATRGGKLETFKRVDLDSLF